MKRPRPAVVGQQASAHQAMAGALSLPRVGARGAPQAVPTVFGENTDEALMVRYCEGDFPAMETLVDRYHRRLNAFFFRVLHSSDVVDDLVQDTFIRLMEQAHRYQPTGRFSTYLFTIAANLLKDDRRRSHRKDLSLEDFTSEAYRFEMSDFASKPFGSEVEDAVAARQVRFALARLSPDLRVALVLRHYHGFTYEEIADIVRCPVGTVKSRVHLALEQLRAMLGGEEK